MSPRTHGGVSLFNFGHCNRYFIVLLTWIFQMTHDIEHLFCAYLPSLSLLWWSTQGFAQVVVRFPPLLLSVLYIFCTQFLYQIWFGSLSLWLYIFFINSLFEEQKYLFLSTLIYQFALLWVMSFLDLVVVYRNICLTPGDKSFLLFYLLEVL